MAGRGEAREVGRGGTGDEGPCAADRKAEDVAGPFERNILEGRGNR